MSQLPKKRMLYRDEQTLPEPKKSGPKMQRCRQDSDMAALAKKKISKINIPKVGLCAHCLNADECTYPKDPDRPTLFCDEYVGYEARPEPKVTNVTVTRTAAKPHAAESEEGTYRGLCRTCANREHCTFPRPEGGVWRCEEYV